MNKKIAFFLPTRKGSLRVKDKNIRPFAWFEGGLLENKLIQLSKLDRIDEIILSTNDQECIRIAKPFLATCPKLKIIERPEHLCLDSTNLKDLIAYVPTITDADIIVWGHVTTPVFGTNDYNEAIETYLNQSKIGFDSLLSVLEFKNFLLNIDAKIVNNNSAIPWPRTQDLETLFEINHAVFIATRETYQTNHNRIGSKPYLLLTSKIKSVDVDYDDDFQIAEKIYEKYYGL